MSAAGQISELLARWEDLRSQGAAVSPEELCRDRPHLLPELQSIIRRLDSLDALFHTNRNGEAPTDSLEPCPSGKPAAGLPTVPGYEILGELGRVGMGVVYKASDTR